MLQIPAKQKLTKWEEYARQKGISKTKKSRKVFDEKTKVSQSSVFKSSVVGRYRNKVVKNTKHVFDCYQ